MASRIDFPDGNQLAGFERHALFSHAPQTDSNGVVEDGNDVTQRPTEPGEFAHDQAVASMKLSMRIGLEKAGIAASHSRAGAGLPNFTASRFPP